MNKKKLEPATSNW